MKKIVLSIILVMIAFSAFSTTLYDTTIIPSLNKTIAVFANRLAGPNGSVTYFDPSIQKPTNINYEYAGVTIQNEYGVVSYIFLADKISETAKIYQIVIDNKTISFDGKTANDIDAIEKVFNWETSSPQVGLAPIWELTY